MKNRLGEYLAASVPRYTSYPTAPHFSDRIAGAAYGEWLAALEPSSPVSLYLHVPYCRQACWYCGCSMKLVARPEIVSQYADMLIKELELIRRHLLGRMTLAHLHWGGGTPTSMLPDDLVRLMAKVREMFDFTEEAEIAIECDPRTLSQEMITTIGALGFNRASFGVQEFDDRVQRAINRIQPPETVESSCDRLRDAGVSAINFDLIYGLPHQTVEGIVSTVERCVTMAPSRVALFGYAHVPWMAKRQRMIDADALPDPRERLAQSSAAARTLEYGGYLPIGHDHFALPEDSLARAAMTGRLRRNFQGYTSDSAQSLIGVGASSISRTPKGYAQNITETGQWARTVASGVLPVARGHAFAGEDTARAAVIEALMCYGSADLRGIGDDHQLPQHWAMDAVKRLDAIIADGIATFHDGRISVDPDHRHLSRLVASAFDAYFAQGAARHSSAV